MGSKFIVLRYPVAAELSAIPTQTNPSDTQTTNSQSQSESSPPAPTTTAEPCPQSAPAARMWPKRSSSASFHSSPTPPRADARCHTRHRCSLRRSFLCLLIPKRNNQLIERQPVRHLTSGRNRRDCKRRTLCCGGVKSRGTRSLRRHLEPVNLVRKSVGRERRRVIHHVKVQMWFECVPRISH